MFGNVNYFCLETYGGWFNFSQRSSMYNEQLFVHFPQEEHLRVQESSQSLLTLQFSRLTQRLCDLP